MPAGVMFTKSIKLELEPEQELLLAVGLWLRSLKSNPNSRLSMFLNTLVDDWSAEKFRFSTNVPRFPENVMCTSLGKVYEVPDRDESHAYVEVSGEPWIEHGCNMLHPYRLFEDSCHCRHKINPRWIQWAIATWMVEFYVAGLDWYPVKAPMIPLDKSIGGMEIMEFI